MNCSCILLILLLFCNNNRCESYNNECRCNQRESKKIIRNRDNDCGCVNNHVGCDGPSYYAREKMEDGARTVRAIDRDCGCQATSEEV